MMSEKLKKSKRIAVGFLIVWSLFVSSVAACVCPHHAEKSEIETSSCHEHSETANESDSSENARTLESNDECACLQTAPKAFSKSEPIKIEKQKAVLSLTQIEIKFVSQVFCDSKVYFEKPFYLSDSFYNIKSPRAPPIA